MTPLRHTGDGDPLTKLNRLVTRQTGFLIQSLLQYKSISDASIDPVDALAQGENLLRARNAIGQAVIALATAQISRAKELQSKNALPVDLQTFQEKVAREREDTLKLLNDGKLPDWLTPKAEAQEQGEPPEQFIGGVIILPRMALKNGETDRKPKSRIEQAPPVVVKKKDAEKEKKKKEKIEPTMHILDVAKREIKVGDRIHHLSPKQTAICEAVFRVFEKKKRAASKQLRTAIQKAAAQRDVQIGSAQMRTGKLLKELSDKLGVDYPIINAPERGRIYKKKPNATIQVIAPVEEKQLGLSAAPREKKEKQRVPISSERFNALRLLIENPKADPDSIILELGIIKEKERRTVRKRSGETRTIRKRKSTFHSKQQAAVSLINVVETVLNDKNELNAAEAEMRNLVKSCIKKLNMRNEEDLIDYVRIRLAHLLTLNDAAIIANHINSIEVPLTKLGIEVFKQEFIRRLSDRSTLHQRKDAMGEKEYETWLIEKRKRTIGRLMLALQLVDFKFFETNIKDKDILAVIEFFYLQAEKLTEALKGEFNISWFVEKFGTTSNYRRELIVPRKPVATTSLPLQPDRSKTFHRSPTDRLFEKLPREEISTILARILSKLGNRKALTMDELMQYFPGYGLSKENVEQAMRLIQKKKKDKQSKFDSETIVYIMCYLAYRKNAGTTMKKRDFRLLRTAIESLRREWNS